MAFKLEDRVQTKFGPGKVVWVPSEEQRTAEPHEVKDRNGNVVRTNSWKGVVHVEVDPVPPAQRGSTFAFREEELSKLEAQPDASPSPAA